MKLSKNEAKAIRKGLKQAFPETEITTVSTLEVEQIIINLDEVDRNGILELSVLAEDWDVSLQIKSTKSGLLIIYS